MTHTEFMGQGWEMMPWYGMIFGPIMMVVMLVVFVMVIRCIGGGGSCGMSKHAQQSGEKSALDILKERFAKGEIDKKEFEEKKKLISN